MMWLASSLHELLPQTSRLRSSWVILGFLYPSVWNLVRLDRTRHSRRQYKLIESERILWLLIGERRRSRLCAQLRFASNSSSCKGNALHHFWTITTDLSHPLQQEYRPNFFILVFLWSITHSQTIVWVHVLELPLSFGLFLFYNFHSADLA